MARQALLAAFALAVSVAAAPAPIALRIGVRGDGDAQKPGVDRLNFAAAGGRRALQQAAGGTTAGGQRDPLPNFEMGVRAPPSKSFRDWQLAGVQERPQEFGSASFLTPGHPGLGYVAACVVARDAHADMLEWVNHHVRLGVSKIYLWDHASQPPMRSVVQGYIAAGIVEYEHFSEFQHASGKPQLFAYDRCLGRGHLHTWMAFIDVDEFLMFRDPWPPIQSLPAFLRGFEGPGPPPAAVSGVAVHWLIFGSSSHEARPPGGTLRSYHRCLPLRHAQHALVKTIVRTACTVAPEGPHNFVHNCSQPVQQTDGTPILGARSEEPVHTRLALHHYATKSRDEFALKMVRGSAMKRQRGWEFFDFVDDWSTEWNWDGLTVWDTVSTFQHYPAITEEVLKRYAQEKHEDFWLKGADDPRYKEQQRQQAAAAGAAAGAAGAAAGAAAAQEQADAAGAAQLGLGAAAAGGVEQQAAGAAAQGQAAAAALNAQQQAAAAQQQQQQQQHGAVQPQRTAEAAAAAEQAAAAAQAEHTQAIVDAALEKHQAATDKAAQLQQTAAVDGSTGSASQVQAAAKAQQQ